MEANTQKKKIGWWKILVAFLVFGFIVEKSGCDKDIDINKDTQVETTKHETTPTMTETEYLKYFQDKWDAVTLEKVGKFPQYEKYQSSLEKVLQEMLSVLQKDPNYKFDSPSKLNNLRLKFIDSKRMKTAISNFSTYGQPLMSDELKDACETFLKENANDPSSIDIDNYIVERQSKNGWIVVVKYRGKNAFGGLVLNISTCDVRFNLANKIYYCVSAE